MYLHGASIHDEQSGMVDLDQWCRNHYSR